ncbi:MAG TPA: hypothetical protein VEU08_19265 [Vicinamibacterales bacterium]|nr:hypothetical protein [Vicinamibacterales bacterium]
MKQLRLSPPLLMFVVGTRAAMAFGAGLLASERIPAEVRRRLGFALVGLGIATTIPAALQVFGSSNAPRPALEPHSIA